MPVPKEAYYIEPRNESIKKFVEIASTMLKIEHHFLVKLIRDLSILVRII